MNKRRILQLTELYGIDRKEIASKVGVRYVVLGEALDNNPYQRISQETIELVKTGVVGLLHAAGCPLSEAEILSDDPIAIIRSLVTRACNRRKNSKQSTPQMVTAS